MRQPRRAGALILVVGPSGAGKDTLISYLRTQLRWRSDVTVVRRVVTRLASPADEDHESVSEQEFDRRAAHGGFALTWGAHGLRYGLPASLGEALASGRVAVANVSRGVIAEARRRYPRTLVVEVTAPLDVLARRLAARGRETEETIAGRLSRSVAHQVTGDDVVTIDNSGVIEEAGERLVAIALQLLDDASDGPRRRT